MPALESGFGKIRYLVLRQAVPRQLDARPLVHLGLRVSVDGMARGGEGRVLLDGQRVDRGVIRTHCDRLAHGLPPTVRRLAFEAVNQIDAHVAKARAAGRAKALAKLVGRM